MAMMDTVRRLMAGRSEVVERSIDKAVDYLGRSNESLKRQAETVKARARALDPDHPDGAATGGAPTSAPATPPDTPGAPPASTLPPAPIPPPVPPSEAASGSALRGDLVDPPEGPPHA